MTAQTATNMQWYLNQIKKECEFAKNKRIRNSSRKTYPSALERTLNHEINRVTKLLNNE